MAPLNQKIRKQYRASAQASWQSEKLFTLASVRQIAGSGLGPLVVGLICLAIYYVLVETLFRETDSAFANANLYGPVALITMVVFALWYAIRRHPVAIWTPYSLYLAQSAIFFGLGPLVYKLGNEATLASLQRGLFPLSEHMLLKTNLLNAVAIASAALGFLLVSRTRGFKRVRQIDPRHNPPKIRLEVLALSFLAAGALLKYLVIIPYAFGMSDRVVPGFINNLANLYDLGLAVAAYLAVTNRVWLVVLWTLLPLHVAVVLLEFSKTGLVISLFLPALGAYLRHSSLKRLMVWIIGIAVVFYLAQPFVQYGRTKILAETETIYRATLPERLAITEQFLLEKDALGAIDTKVEQAAWMRLAYAGPQAFAMQEHDAGRPGDSLKSAWIVFVPRAIWPDKPIGIGPGEDFYEQVTGRRGTHLGLSVYGDLYWQFGWAGVILLSAAMGALFAVMSKWTLAWIGSRQLIYLPAILISMLMALDGPTKFFINGILGGISIYLAYIFAIWFFLKFIKARQNSAFSIGRRPHSRSTRLQV